MRSISLFSFHFFPLFDLDFDLGRVLARGLDRTLTLDLVRDLVHVLERDPIRALDSDLALDLVRALDPILVRTLARIESNRPINTRFALPIVVALILSRALDRVLSFSISSRSRKWWQWSSQSKNTDRTDAYLRMSIYSALDLYAHLLVLELRQSGQLPVWEGILLVKESRQKEFFEFASPENAPNSVSASHIHKFVQCLSDLESELSTVYEKRRFLHSVE